MTEMGSGGLGRDSEKNTLFLTDFSLLVPEALLLILRKREIASRSIKCGFHTHPL